MNEIKSLWFTKYNIFFICLVLDFDLLSKTISVLQRLSSRRKCIVLFSIKSHDCLETGSHPFKAFILFLLMLIKIEIDKKYSH